MKVRIYKILKRTKVEGPGNRYCIWFQGCSKKCKGCFAKATHNFKGGKEYDITDILLDIFSVNDIEGVTFLGGEPFEQPVALEYIAKRVQERGLSVVCFTGNLIENLQVKYSDILQNIDLLIDGEYIEEQRDFSRPWVGSKNQRYHFLTNRYNESILKEYTNKIEVNVQENGTIFINGMGDFEKVVKSFEDMLLIH